MLDCFPSRASCGFLLGVNWRQPESDWQMENVDRCGAPRHVLIIKSVTGAHTNIHRRAHTHNLTLDLDHAICLCKYSARLNTVIRFIYNKCCDYYSQYYLIRWCLMISRLQFHYWGLWSTTQHLFFFFLVPLSPHMLKNTWPYSAVKGKYSISWPLPDVPSLFVSETDQVLLQRGSFFIKYILRHYKNMNVVKLWTSLSYYHSVFKASLAPYDWYFL